MAVIEKVRLAIFYSTCLFRNILLQLHYYVPKKRKREFETFHPYISLTFSHSIHLFVTLTNNSFALSLSQNSLSSNSRSTSFWDNHIGSSSQCPHHPPPIVGTNQPKENLLLPTSPSKKPRGWPPGSKNKHKTISL